MIAEGLGRYDGQNPPSGKALRDHARAEEDGKPKAPPGDPGRRLVLSGGDPEPSTT